MLISKYKDVAIIALFEMLALYSISNFSLRVNAIVIANIMLGTIFIAVMSRGMTFYNAHFMPIFIFSILSLVILSPNLSDIMKNTYIDEALFLIFFMGSFLSVANKPLSFYSKINNKFIWLFLILFFISGVISTYINQVPFSTSVLGGALILKPIIILIGFLLFTITEDSKKYYYLYIKYLFTLLCLISIIWSFIFEFILSSNPAVGVDVANEFISNIPAFRSFYFHTNGYSSIMIILSNYFFSYYLLTKSKSKFGLFLCCIAGLLTSSRIKVIILLPVTIMLIWMLYASIEAKQATKKKHTKQIIIVLLFIPFLMGSIYISKNKIIRYSFSENVRREILVTSFLVSKSNYWLGAGFGRFGSAISTKNYSPEYFKYGLNDIYGASPKKANFITDQWWGWYIGETGIIGMLFFLSALLFVSQELICVVRRSHFYDKNLSVIAYTALGALVYGVGSGFASGSLSGPPASYFIMGLIGLAFNIPFGKWGKNSGL